MIEGAPDSGHRAQQLEWELGDPRDVKQAFSFTRSLELDEQDAYPEAACRLLDDAGIQKYYVPKDDGGELTTFPELAAIFRLVARRDLTVAIAHHKTFLGAVHTWTAGTPAQRAAVAAYVKAGGRMALAYHEQAHGSDLLAMETFARAAPGGYRLTGEKWLVNNATRGDLQTVFARTTDRGGP